MCNELDLIWLPLTCREPVQILRLKIHNRNGSAATRGATRSYTCQRSKLTRTQSTLARERWTCGYQVDLYAVLFDKAVFHEPIRGEQMVAQALAQLPTACTTLDVRLLHDPSATPSRQFKLLQPCTLAVIVTGTALQRGPHYLPQDLHFSRRAPCRPHSRALGCNSLSMARSTTSHRFYIASLHGIWCPVPVPRILTASCYC